MESRCNSTRFSPWHQEVVCGQLHVPVHLPSPIRGTLKYWASGSESPYCLGLSRLILKQEGSSRERNGLRHCPTSRKIAGSIPDGLFGIFYWLNPSGRNMALGSTQSLTEMSTTGISLGSTGSQCVGVTSRLSRNSGSPNLLDP